MRCKRLRDVLFTVVVMVVGTWTCWSMSETEMSQWVGAGTCRNCHPQAYQVWVDSAHARTNGALAKESQADPKCTQCHGLSVSGKQGVQCESCHGSGRYYAKHYVMKDRVLARIVGLVDVTEDVCKRCHVETAPNIRSFDHEEMWRLIFHGREADSNSEASHTVP